MPSPQRISLPRRKWRAPAPALALGFSPASAALPPVSPASDAPSRRSVRVALLLFAIALLNLADLSLTLTHLSAIGMAEANPVARAVIRATGAAGLIAYKLALVGLGLVILFRLRRDVRAEVCAWCMALAMTLLIHQWRLYGREMVSAAPAILDSPPREVWIAPPPSPRAS